MGSIVAALQVQEAIKLHQGDRGSLAGRKLVLNGRINDFYPVTANAKPECLAHETFGAITEEPGWTAAGTTARQVLDRFRADTGRTYAVATPGMVIVGLAR